MAEKDNVVDFGKKEPVDLELMLNEPVPFAKFQKKVYSVKTMTIEDAGNYGKTLILGPPVYSLVDEKTMKNLEECFDKHVVDEEGKPVKFKEIAKTWPDEGIRIFVNTILKISG